MQFFFHCIGVRFRQLSKCRRQLNDNFADSFVASISVNCMLSKLILWNIYEIIHICTAVVDECEE